MDTEQHYDLRIPAPDGYPLAATLYNGRDPRRMAIITSATGVPRRLYRHLAAFLCERTGTGVITFDYRGIGDSRPPHLRGMRARMRDWAELDIPAILRYTQEQHPSEQIWMIGHSFGGQALGLLEHPEAIGAVVAVSAQSGYWRLQPGIERYRIWLYMHLIFPVLTRLIGYFPWRRISGAEDLPYGVALEWARWCRSPSYLLGDPTLRSSANFPRFRAPILAYSFSDDVWGSAQSVDWMMAQYVNARITRRHVAPADIGVPAIKHFGFFKPSARALWEETADWLVTHGTVS